MDESPRRKVCEDLAQQNFGVFSEAGIWSIGRCKLQADDLFCTAHILPIRIKLKPCESLGNVRSNELHTDDMLLSCGSLNKHVPYFRHCRCFCVVHCWFRCSLQSLC